MIKSDFERISSVAAKIQVPSVGTVVAGCVFVREGGVDKRSRAVWVFRCECGEEFARGATIQLQAQRRGQKRLCGDTSRHAGSRAISLPEKGAIIAGCKFIREIGLDAKRNRVWEFECQCGKIFSRLASQQRHRHKNGEERLCGDVSRHIEVKVGQTYQRWTVIRFIKVPAWSKEKGDFQRTKAICKCSCGNPQEKDVWPYHLLNGDSGSCGCLRLERISEAKTTHGLSDTQQQYMWSQAQGRAKAKGLIFDLDIEDCAIPEICPILGIPIIQIPRGEKIAGRKRSPNSPSTHRINPRGGYTKDNVLIVSWMANDLIKNGSLEEFQRIVQFYSALQSLERVAQ